MKSTNIQEMTSWQEKKKYGIHHKAILSRKVNYYVFELMNAQLCSLKIIQWFKTEPWQVQINTVTLTQNDTKTCLLNSSNLFVWNNKTCRNIKASLLPSCYCTNRTQSSVAELLNLLQLISNVCLLFSFSTWKMLNKLSLLLGSYEKKKTCQYSYEITDFIK